MTRPGGLLSSLFRFSLFYDYSDYHYFIGRMYMARSAGHKLSHFEASTYEMLGLLE